MDARDNLACFPLQDFRTPALFYEKDKTVVIMRKFSALRVIQ